MIQLVYINQLQVLYAG